MSTLQPQSYTPGNANLWSYFDVKMIEKLTLLFPPFYNLHKKICKLISIGVSPSQELEIAQDILVLLNVAVVPRCCNK